jgi:hypothetical protein
MKTAEQHRWPLLGDDHTSAKDHGSSIFVIRDQTNLRLTDGPVSKLRADTRLDTGSSAHFALY